MESLLAVVAISASLLSVAWQVRAGNDQAERARRAEQMADAFFAMFHAFAENRRAQLDPPDEALLRSSSAAFYSAGLRITTLADDDTVEALRQFMQSGLDLTDENTSAVSALWDLHDRVVRDLEYRDPLPRELLVDLFQRRSRNTPVTHLGKIEQPRAENDVRSSSSAKTSGAATRPRSPSAS